MNSLVLAIDFDGVIHDYAHPLPGRRMGPPIEGAKEAIESYRGRGCEIIVHSVWAHDAGVGTIEAWMNFYKIPFDSITNIKPKADYYIDDHAVKFTSWNEITI